MSKMFMVVDIVTVGQMVGCKNSMHQYLYADRTASEYNALFLRLRTSEIELGRLTGEHCKAYNELTKSPVESQILIQSEDAFESTAQQLSSAIEMVSMLHVKLIDIMTRYQYRLSHSLKDMRMERRARLATDSVGSQTISLWTSVAKKRKPVFNIPTGPRGKHWSRIIEFVESVCDPIDGKFKLKDVSGKEIKPGPDTYITAGYYELEPVDGSSELVFVEKRYEIIPSGPVGKPLAGSVVSGSSVAAESSSPDPSRKRALDCASNTERSANFTIAVYQRDNHCLISKDTTSLEASHILAHSWWSKYEYRRAMLPDSVVEAVEYLDDNIDDVKNGLLLRRDLAAAFDNGDFSLQFQDGHYRVVSLTKQFESLDGLMLDENRRVRTTDPAGGSSTCQTPPWLSFTSNRVFSKIWLQVDRTTLISILMTTSIAQQLVVKLPTKAAIAM
jgi:hypothetical protein